MATIKLNNLLSHQIDALHNLAKGHGLNEFDCDGEYFKFPLSKIYDVREITGHRPEWIDISDDIISCFMRYRTSSDTVVLSYEMDDLDLGEIVLRFTDKEMKELIAEAGFAELQDGHLSQYIQTGTDQYGEPVEEEYNPSVFEWCDCGENDTLLNIQALLVAFLIRKQNRYYIEAKAELMAAA